MKRLGFVSRTLTSDTTGFTFTIQKAKVPLPQRLKEQLKMQVAYVKELHERDADEGFGTVEMPHALARKYPNAHKELRWQYLFPM